MRLALLALGALAATATAAEPLRVTVNARSEVAAAVATLADVAALTGDADLVARAGLLPVVQLPDLGQRRVDADAVRRALRTLPAAAGAVIAGSGSVVRRAEVLDADRLVAVALAHAQAGAGTVEVSVVRAPEAFAIAAGAAPTLTATALDPSPTGRIAYRITASRGSVELGRALAVLDVRRFIDAVVPAAAVPRGTRLETALVRRERVELRRGFDDLVADPAAVAGLVARLDLPAGRPLRTNQLERPPAVRPGEAIRLVVRLGQAEIGAEGTALGSAALGGAVPVRRADGSQARGVVIAPGVVALR
jgi:flagella basal body P-ring formation protein FlgA